MQARNKFKLIFKFVGKIFLGLLLLLMLGIILLHVPAIQKQITRKVSIYLSDQTKGRIEIQKIKFSLTGDLMVENIHIWDPEDNEIFSAGNIAITSSLLDLLRGRYIIQEISIKNAKGHISENEEGLNIQFLIDAFRPEVMEVTDTTVERHEIIFQFNKITLDSIDFNYSSTISGMTIATHLGKFSSTDTEFSSSTFKIKADKVRLNQTVVNILSAPGTDTVTHTIVPVANTYFTPDFGSGLVMDIMNLDLEDCGLSYHVNTIVNTPKFDPAHIDLARINISVSDILMNADSLDATLKHFSVHLPGFIVTDSKGGVKLNRQQLFLSDFLIASDDNEFHADVNCKYQKNASDVDELCTDIVAKGLLYPRDLVYFFDERSAQYFKDWESAELTLMGNYTAGVGQVNTFELKTPNSQFHATGLLKDILESDKLSWNEMQVQASIGSDFKRVLHSFLGDKIIEPDIRLQVSSTGNLKKLFLDGNASSTWGNVKAKGYATQLSDNIELDMRVNGDKVLVGKWMGLPWIGSTNMAVEVKGKIGKNQDLHLVGTVPSIVLLDNAIQQITFESRLGNDNATTTLSIEDPQYHSKIQSHVSFAGPIVITNEMQLTDFLLSSLMQLDSTFTLSGNFKSKVTLDGPSIEGYVYGNSFEVRSPSREYFLDTITLDAKFSPSSSSINYQADNGRANLQANFNLADAESFINSWSNSISSHSNRINIPEGNKTLTFSLEMDNPGPLVLLGVPVQEFSNLRLSGGLDEQKQTIALQGTSGPFIGYGITLDTMHADIGYSGDSIRAILNVHDLSYNAYQLGNMAFHLDSRQDTAVTFLSLSKDTVTYFDLGVNILPAEEGIFIFPDKLDAYGHHYRFGWNKPVLLKDRNITLDQFRITRDNMEMSFNGDLHAFDVDMRNVNLTHFNVLLRQDSNVIDKGRLDGTIAYIRNQQLNFKADIDSLIVYNSIPISIAATAERDANRIPFTFLLSNTTNKVDVSGQYLTDNKELDATVILDVNNLEMFTFLVPGVMEEMKGGLQGDIRILGPVNSPQYDGSVRFVDSHFTTADPKFTVNIKDETIHLDNSGLLFDNFTIHDGQGHPLTLNGNVTTKNYPSYAYDLKINSDAYTLIDRVANSKDQLIGLLVIGADVQLSGNEKDTYVKADIDVKDTTSLTFIYASDADELASTREIVEFIDPSAIYDSTSLEPDQSYYDSLVATLPDFNLNSTIKIENGARLRVVLDPESGDFFETSGNAELELSQDRTGNLNLAGIYTIEKGVYRISFYDLVKKNFVFVKGSSVNWSGAPENGVLDIKAVHTVQSNSIGLIGHEIGENEMSTYKKSLDYEVGVIISGTVERPIVSFSLDLPENEKANYPALASKLERLKQPEYQSELNKQVFGLLVLGGFIPEASTSDINEGAIATTALYNSVNSLLSSQLNRFAGQYIKGVTIDVGIQSYADYSAPGGETRTAMDFHVSKSIMNDRLSFEVGGDFDINPDQSGANTGDNYRGDVAIIYDLTGNGDKKLKLFNNETYDIVYQEIRNTGVSLVFIREFNREKKTKKRDK